MTTPADRTEPPSPQPAARPVWELPLVVMLLAAVVWTACFGSPAVWIITGIGEPDKPFLDLRYVISAGEAQQLGLDPHVSNPLDPYHRVHSYSDWWLVTGRLGLTRADLAWVGATLLLLTLAAAAWVCRPRTIREGGDLLLALVSPPLLMAVHRANNDLVAFVLMSVALVSLRRGGTVARALAIGLLALSAALKYFPLAAVVLLIEARTRRELFGWIALYGTVLLLALPGLVRGFGFVTAHAPTPDWLYAFGAPVVFRNFELGSATLLGAVGGGALLLAGLVRGWPRAGGPVDAPRPAPEFLAGAVMIVGCFLAGSSYAYKLVFSLWLLPWFWGTAAGPGDAADRRRVRWLWLAVLWTEGLAAIAINLASNYAGLPPPIGLRCLAGALLVSQLLTWALVYQLWKLLVNHGVGQLRRWRPA
jgi:hypothetical protein